MTCLWLWCFKTAYHLQSCIVMCSDGIGRKYRGRGRNVTADNWFTSYPLVKSLRKNYRLTYVGTVRTNKRKISRVMFNKENYSPVRMLLLSAKTWHWSLLQVPQARQTKSSFDGFLPYITIQWFVKMASLKLLCSLLLNYSRKRLCGCILSDVFLSVMQPHDQKLASYVFYGILNAAVVNSYTLYEDHKSQTTLKRQFFQKKLALCLI